MDGSHNLVVYSIQRTYMGGTRVVLVATVQTGIEYE